MSRGPTFIIIYLHFSIFIFFFLALEVKDAPNELPKDTPADVACAVLGLLNKESSLKRNTRSKSNFLER